MTGVTAAIVVPEIVLQTQIVPRAGSASAGVQPAIDFAAAMDLLQSPLKTSVTNAPSIDASTSAEYGETVVAEPLQRAMLRLLGRVGLDDAQDKETADDNEAQNKQPAVPAAAIPIAAVSATPYSEPPQPSSPAHDQGPLRRIHSNDAPLRPEANPPAAATLPIHAIVVETFLPQALASPPVLQLANAIANEAGLLMPQHTPDETPLSAPRHIGVLRLTLDPADLGKVEVRLRLQGESLDIAMAVENPRTMSQIVATQDRLADAIRDAGYDIGDLSILRLRAASPAQAVESSIAVGDGARLPPMTNNDPRTTDEKTHDGPMGRDAQSDAHPGRHPRGQRRRAH